MRRISLVAAVVWALSAPLLAANFFYELQLIGQGRALARDYPVERVSVLLFHSYPAGTFTSVPREAVLRIVLRSSEFAARALKPGETVLLGATGGGQGGADATVVGKRPLSPTAPQDSNPYGYGVGAGAYAYGMGTARRGNLPIPGSPAGQPIGSNGFPSGDLARAASGEPPMISGNGFPAAGGAPALATGANEKAVGPNFRLPTPSRP